jgi:hypothetical protein
MLFDRLVQNQLRSPQICPNVDYDIFYLVYVNHEHPVEWMESGRPLVEKHRVADKLVVQTTNPPLPSFLSRSFQPHHRRFKRDRFLPGFSQFSESLGRNTAHCSFPLTLLNVLS